MRVAERTLLALALMLGLSGCRAFNNGSLSMTPKPLVRSTFDLEAFVAEHNRNADRIESVTAKPSIGVAGRLTKARADGRLALERPRNFKLELWSVGDKKADMGSNDEEFWFWVQNDKDRSIYWCRYTELDSSALAMTHQPDWIIEALGLRPISSEEAKKITVKKGPETGTTELMFPPTGGGGETYTRLMVVWDKTRRIKEHRIYAGNRQVLLAQADVKSYSEFELDRSDGEKTERCYLPDNIRLDWKREQLSLDVLLRREDVKINQFDSSKSAAIFVEPEIPGYERVNLAELSRRTPKAERASVRHTLPPPDSRNGVRLGRPTPVRDQPAQSDEPSPTVGQSSSALKPVVLDELVTAPLPVSPETGSTRAASAISDTGAYSPIGR
jgi:hypothetical protein